MQRRERRARQPSNVFSMLTPSQITSLKVVFNMIDKTKDEIICANDLNQFLPGILSPSQMKEFDSIETNLNFYAILSLLSDKFIGLQTKDKIATLLREFSDDKKTVSKSQLVLYLTDEGMDKYEIEYILNVFESDRIEIDDLTNLLRHGEIRPDVKR